MCVCVHAGLCTHARTRNGTSALFLRNSLVRSHIASEGKPYCVTLASGLHSLPLVLEPSVWFMTTFSQARNSDCHYSNCSLICSDQKYRCYIPLGENMHVPMRSKRIFYSFYPSNTALLLPNVSFRSSSHTQTLPCCVFTLSGILKRELLVFCTRKIFNNLINLLSNHTHEVVFLYSDDSGFIIFIGRRAP